MPNGYALITHHDEAVGKRIKDSVLKTLFKKVLSRVAFDSSSKFCLSFDSVLEISFRSSKVNLKVNPKMSFRNSRSLNS